MRTDAKCTTNYGSISNRTEKHNITSIVYPDLDTECSEHMQQLIPSPHDQSENDSGIVAVEPKRACGVRMTSWYLFLYVMFYVLFLVTGALFFMTIEQPEENALRERIRLARRTFAQTNPCVEDQALEAFIEEIVRASNRGVSAARNVSGEPNWSFGQSLFFSSTVVTTIGYGHVTPLSKEGKIFCMVYALFGIPLTLVLLTALVERLLVPATWLLQALNSRLGHLYQPFNIRLLHLFIIVVLLTGLFLCAPAGVFATVEPDWDFLDSLYYCFISLTTIGLGDYIPGDSPDQPYRPMYKVATTIYLLVGLTFMMFTLTIFYDIPQLNLGILFAVNSEGSYSSYEPSEKLRLATGSHLRNEYGASEANVTGHRAVVRVRSRRDDSPSPEDTTPVHAKDMLVP